MLMKKIFCLAIALLMIFSFVSCTGGGEEVSSDDTEASDVPVVSLVCEKTKVTPGEEVTVKVHISNAPLTACFDIFTYADAVLECEAVETPDSDVILAANKEEMNGEVYAVVRGMVASTYDILDDDVCEIIYKVRDDASSGTKINLTLQVPVYQLGLDETGNDVYSVKCALQGLVLEVK